MSPSDSRPREHDQLRLGVAAAGRLHLAVDGRSLCGRVMADELDLYSDGAGLRAWNTGPLERCAQCTTALIARSRDPAPARTAAARPQSAAQMLAAFHSHRNCAPEDAALRLTLHREEHRELEEQLEAERIDRANLARELADVTYACYGSALMHGIDLDAALREVHRAALDKLEANLRREDGKLLKPPGFQPPDMSAAIGAGSHCYLCGNCGTISADDWEAFKRDDEGELTAATTGDHDPVIRCPTCRYDHTDDDADPGVWGGTLAEMERERARLVRDRPHYSDEWSQVLAAEAA